MREPVRKSVVVRCPVEHAFDVFTRQVHAWWPRSHRRHPDGLLKLEPGVGGELVEYPADGSPHVIGLVEVWEPPSTLQLSWNLGAPPETPTRVRVTFVPDREATRVDVVHGEGDRPLDSWPTTVALFNKGWSHLLDALSRHVDE